MNDKEFCRWVTKRILEPWEDPDGNPDWELFAEMACRKLTKLGYMRLDNGYYIENEGRY